MSELWQLHGESLAVEKALKSKRIAIVQSNYIPWKGYFELIRSVDEFILLDNVQYTRCDWRNRNRIKTRNGATWLTIPVRSKGHFGSRICDVQTADDRWRERHVKALRHSYRRAPAYDAMMPTITSVYESCPSRWLTEINRHFICQLCDLLRIQTPIRLVTEMKEVECCTDSTQRLVRICQAVGASIYVSGKKAAAYLKGELFDEAGIALTYFDYPPCHVYSQPFPPFVPRLSILDTVLCHGLADQSALPTVRSDRGGSERV